MAEKDEDPDEETVDQETAVPLPERDAMSIIGGGQPLPGLVGDVLPQTDPAEPGIQPPPRYNV